MTSTLEIGTKISRIMNLDFLQHQKMLYSFFMQPSMANLNSPSSRVVKDSMPFRRRILRCINFGNGESLPSLFLDVVNLYLIKFRER